MKTAMAVLRHKKRDGLRCRRCDGLMLPERLYDQMLGFGPMDCWGWRYIVCGELIDPLILEHRHERAVSRQQPKLHQEAG
jgi:hypothetical protein